MINDIIFEQENASISRSSSRSEATRSSTPESAPNTTTTSASNNGGVRRSWIPGRRGRTTVPLPREQQQQQSPPSSSSINVLERLQQTLRRIESSPSAHLFRNDHRIHAIKQKLQRANYYLKQQQQQLQGTLTSENLRRQKQRLSRLLRVLQEEAIDLVLRLNVDLPQDESDINHIIWEHSTAQERHDQEQQFLMFPPLLHQMVFGQMVHLDNDDEIIEIVSLGGSTVESWDDDDWENDDDDSIWIENEFLHPDYVPWDFKQIIPPRRRWGWGGLGQASSASQSSTCRYDRRLYYSKIQALRALPQSTPISQFRVVLAQLDPGDTTPSVLVGQSVVTAVLGPIYAINGGATIGLRTLLTGQPTFPNVDSAWGDAKMAASSAFQFTKNTFLHFLLEFDLLTETSDDDDNDEGTIIKKTTTCTLERCADDVYLYQGVSSRPRKKAVFFGTAPDLKLRDLIRFRNEQRSTPYHLRGNNCKDLVWKFLATTFDLPLEPKNFSFNGSCQVIYGADWPTANFNNEIVPLLHNKQNEEEEEEEPLLQQTSGEEEEEEESDEAEFQQPPPKQAETTNTQEEEEEEEEEEEKDDEQSANFHPKEDTNTKSKDEIAIENHPTNGSSTQEKRVKDWIQSLREKNE